MLNVHSEDVLRVYFEVELWLNHALLQLVRRFNIPAAVQEKKYVYVCVRSG